MWKCYFVIAVVCICLHGNLSKELLPLRRNDSSHASIAFSATTYIYISHLCRLWPNGLHSWFWLKQFNCVTSFKGSAVHIINQKDPRERFWCTFLHFLHWNLLNTMTVTLKSQFSDLFCGIDQWQEKVCAKCPKTLQSGFKSGSMWTCEGGKARRGLAHAGRWTNEVSCHCHKESSAAVTWRLRRNADKWLVQGRAEWRREPTIAQQKPQTSVFHTCFKWSFPHCWIRLWDEDEDRADRIRRSGILSNLIREGCNRRSAHRQTALTSCPCRGIFRADAAPRLYCF